MDDERVSATAIIAAPADVVFAVLANPATHGALDGTGWVQESLDARPLTAAGQIFSMAMYHPRHPDGDYQIFNEVLAFEPPAAIGWKPGYDAGDGELRFGGWTWHYDLAPTGPAATEVTLTYDWSAVPAEAREYLSFPPFGPDHLRNSLANLARLATS